MLPSDAERRQITVMFCDLVDSTKMADRLDPETFRDVLRRYQAVGVEAVERLGGHIARYIGDGLLIYFGYPHAHEDDAGRAVRAGLAILTDMQRLNGQRTLSEPELAVRIGIHSGWVVVGEMGAGGRRESLAVGKTPHLASRLQEAAPPNGLVISEDTYRLVKAEFECRTLGMHRLKGFTEPVEIYRVLTLRAGLPLSSACAFASPLVGRAPELETLHACLRRLAGGEGGFVAITGESGLGKSRLVAEARQAWAGPGSPLTWLEARALSFGQESSYGLVQEIVQQAAGISGKDGESAAWAKLKSLVAALLSDQAAEVLPYLARLAALPLPDSDDRLKYLDGEALRRQIFLAARRFFACMAQARPLALVIDDWHWVDASSAALLEHLLPLVESFPLLVCVVSRPEPLLPESRLGRLAQTFAPGHSPAHVEIVLAPLEPVDSAQLVRNLLESESVAPRVLQLILDRAGGNPLFVEEVVRALVAVGTIAPDTDSRIWQLTAQADEVTIPDKLQGVIMARVDRLEEDVKQVLRIASVIGQNFSYRVLQACDGADSGLDRCVDELQQMGLICEIGGSPERQYGFKHALTQSAVYESLLLQQRRELHARVGQNIESLFANRLEDFYSRLAYHYVQAEDWRKAQSYLFKAGDEAVRLAADADALRHYEQAMAAYARVHGDHWDPQHRAGLELRLSQAFYRRGEHGRARASLYRVFEHLGCPLPASRWGVRLAIVSELFRQAGLRLLPGIFGRRPPWLTEGAIEIVASASEVLAWIDVWYNRERPLLNVLRALNLAERQDNLYYKALAYASAGFPCTVLRLRRLAAFYTRRGVELAEQVQHPRAIGVAYHMLANCEFHQTEWARAESHLQRARAAYQTIGDLRGWATATSSLAIMWLYTGRWAPMAQLNQQLVELGRNGADSQILAWGLEAQGGLQLHQGLFEAAAESLRQAIRLFEAIPSPMFVAMNMGVLGQTYLRQGRLPEALAVLEDGVQLVGERGLRGLYVTPVRNGLAEAYLARAEQASGTERAGWLRKAGPACRLARHQSQVDRSGQPEALRLSGQHAWLAGRPKAARQWWQRSLAAARQQGQPYDEGMVCLEMGQRLGERACLERGEALLVEVGAGFDLARVRR
jgi:class 3 adenylate cyclase/tetratricopeptide (TPR) repeat protein